MVVSRQPIFIVNLKSNTMKNTLQSNVLFFIFPNICVLKFLFITSFNNKWRADWNNIFLIHIH